MDKDGWPLADEDGWPILNSNKWPVLGENGWLPEKEDELPNVVDLLSRDLEVGDGQNRKHHQNVNLSCYVNGIEQDYWDSRTPRYVKYSIRVHQDSIGTGLHNLLQVSLTMIERAVIEEDSTTKRSTSLSDVKLVCYPNDDDNFDHVDVTSRSEVESIIGSRLMKLQIGQEEEMSFNDIEVTFKIELVPEKK